MNANNTLIDLFTDDDEEEYIQLLQQSFAYAIAYVVSMNAPGTHEPSHPGRSPNINRESQAGHNRIVKNYFAEHPIYDAKLFRRRFRMQRPLFMQSSSSVAVQFFTFFRETLGEGGGRKAVEDDASEDAMEDVMILGEVTRVVYVFLYIYVCHLTGFNEFLDLVILTNSPK